MALPEHSGPHPEPPADLAQRSLPVVALDRSWTRIYRCALDPLYFGRGASNRWDAPAGEFGVLYAGGDAHCAFIETLGQTTGNALVTPAALGERCLGQVTVTRPLRLADLTGPGLVRIGADARLTTGAHAVARRWSRALWEHPAAPDGIIFRARHDPSRIAVAIYDRAAAAVTATLGLSLGDPRQARLVADILNTYGFGL